MAVSVRGLTKIYGQQRAVDTLTFEVRNNEILGFLGPNGAGKSTTMKMITGYIAPDEGSITINGLNVANQPVAIKRQIGYLPEHNPLYLDMYVREYLAWVSQFYGIENKRKRADEVIDLVGLNLECHKQIVQLSKGYRQRVGLAQALLHDPPVLILDEPTAGLDPNQLQEIRSLIKSLGQTKTIIFSTHIMQEVTALCDRVIIIHQGQLKGVGPVSDLGQQLKKTRQLVIECQSPTEAKAFEGIRGVSQVISEADGYRLKVIFEGQDDIRADVFKHAASMGIVLTGMKLEELGAEEVFKALTNKRGA